VSAQRATAACATGREDGQEEQQPVERQPAAEVRRMAAASQAIRQAGEEGHHQDRTNPLTAEQDLVGQGSARCCSISTASLSAHEAIRKATRPGRPWT